MKFLAVTNNLKSPEDVKRQINTSNVAHTRGYFTHAHMAYVLAGDFCDFFPHHARVCLPGGRARGGRRSFLWASVCVQLSVRAGWLSLSLIIRARGAC
jgi:hypothetical protein